MSHNQQVPQTPPRPKRVVMSTPSELPAKQVLFKQVTTPQKFRAPLAKKARPGLPTPEFTPKRKRRVPEDIFGDTPAADRFNFGLLLPLPLTIGSGRAGPSPRKDAGHLLGHPVSVAPLPEAHHAFILKISQDFHFEEEEVPATPGNQLISEQLVKQWHGTLYRFDLLLEEENSDEEWTTTKMSKLPAKRELRNPFIEDPSQAPAATKARPVRGGNPFDPKHQEVDYSTHMELVNHRTGARKVVKLDAAQQKIKPKKLDFSNI